MKLYLVEDYTPELKFEKNSLIVGLTPLACHLMAKSGIAYKIWEDYISAADFMDRLSDYPRQRTLWLKEFDGFLSGIFFKANPLKMPLASIYFYFLGGMVDSIVLRAMELGVIFEKVKADRVIYVSRSPEKDRIDYTLFIKSNEESLFSRLVPLICEKCGRPFERLIIAAADKAKSWPKFNLKKIFSKQNIKKIVAASHLLKALTIDFDMLKLFSEAHQDHLPSGNRKMNILFLNQNSYLRRLMSAAILRGYGAYYHSGNAIIKLGRGIHGIIERIGNIGQATTPINADALTNNISQNQILTHRINELCQVNVESIVMPKLLYFIQKVAPKILFLSKQYCKLFDRLSIDVICLSCNSSLDTYAATAAGHYSGKAKVCYIDHGDQAFDGREIWDNFIVPNDIFVVSNSEVAGYLNKRKSQGKFNANIVLAPIRNAVLLPKKKFETAPKGSKQRVVFVPTLHQGDNIHGINSYPETWYFHWHKQLLEFFGARKDFDFIWKALPEVDQIYDPIPDLIKERKYSNVRYETDSFLYWITKSDRFLSDYQSTPLYEAAFSGLPIFSIYPPFVKIRASAKEAFGRSVQPYADAADGIKKITAFLDSDPAKFVVEMPPLSSSSARIFQSFERALCAEPPIKL